MTEMTSICAGDRDFDDFRSAPCPDGALRLGFFALNDFLLLLKPEEASLVDLNCFGDSVILSTDEGK